MATPTISEYTAHLREDKASMRNYLNAANIETKESDTFTELAEACLRYTGAQLCVYCQPEEPLNKWGLWFKTSNKIEGLPLVVETESIHAFEYAGSTNITFNSTNKILYHTLVEIDNGDILSFGYSLTSPEGGNSHPGTSIFRYFKDTGKIERWFNLIYPYNYTYAAVDGSFFYHKESGLLYFASGSTEAYWASRTSNYYVIDPSSASNTWTLIGSTANGKYKNAPFMGYYDNKLFVLGGVGYYRSSEGSGSGGMNTYDIIDLSTNTVSNHTITELPYLAGYAQVGQYIYCIGGCKYPTYLNDYNLANRKNYTTISRFNMSTKLMEWDLCDVGTNYTYTKYNNKGIVIGTKIYWFVNKDTQHVYDFATNTFSIENLINYPEALEPTTNTFTMPTLIEDGTKILFGYSCINLYPEKPYINVNKKEQDVDCITITNVKYGESNISTQLYYDYLIKGVLKQYFSDAWLYNKATGYDKLYSAYYGNGEEWILMREGILKDYQPIEYIRTTANCYLDTGYLANNKTKIIAEASLDFKYSTVYAGGIETVKGITFSGQYVTFGIIGNYDAVTAYCPLGRLIHIEQSIEGTYVDGTKLIDSHQGEFSNTNSLYLLGSHYNNGSWPSDGPCTLYSLQIYEDGILLHNYIPCRRIEDSIVGMFDTITNKFIINLGSGSLEAGPNLGE